MPSLTSVGVLVFLAHCAGMAVGCTEVQMMSPTGELVIANALEAGFHTKPLKKKTATRGGSHGGHADGCMTFVAK